MGFEKGTYARGVPSNQVLQDRDKHAQSIVAEDRSFGNLGNLFRLRNRNGEAIASVHMQHDMNIRASVSNIHNSISRYLQFDLQVVQDGDFTITSRHLNDRFYLT